jgi:hypothetical protein
MTGVDEVELARGQRSWSHLWLLGGSNPAPIGSSILVPVQRVPGMEHQNTRSASTSACSISATAWRIWVVVGAGPPRQ